MNKKFSIKNTILQLSAPYTNPSPSSSAPLDPLTLVPSDEYIKAYHNQMKRQKFPVLK